MVEVEPAQRSGRAIELPDDQLIAALVNDDPVLAAAAAFVAGRCTTNDAESDRIIASALDEVVASVDTSQRLGRKARLYVEAVMSAALLGADDDARRRFEAMLGDDSRSSTADHLAAGYLAQLGDPMGYPALVQDLHDRDSSHVRGLAIDQLLAFVPYDGAKVGKSKVDVVSELRQALRDKDSDVGIDAVAAILDSQLDGTDALLDEATKRPHNRDVRDAATAALERRISLR